jgi:RNA polymerase sigma-70 factor (ECF subfamily)
MAARGRATDLEALLAHSGWVRSLAARLVRDPGEADDLAQETLLAAHRRVPEQRGGLKPWLARVLRNLAARGRRDRARAELRERAVARGESLPSAGELVADEELRALVGEALVTVPEPFRSTLILRYFGGLEPTEIARREGIPPVTVRTRVKRGLEYLREELDRRHGGREAWSGLVVRLLDWKHAPVAAGATIAGGWIAMSAGWKIAAAVAAVAVTLSLSWWAIERNTPLSPASEPLARSQPATLESLDSAKPVANGERSPSERERLPSMEDSTAKPAAAAKPSEMVLEARAVDSVKRPIEGVSMEIPGFVQRGTSDADGRLRLVFPGKEGWESKAWFKKSGWATRIVATIVRAGETVGLGDVVLEQACVITGHLEDRDGKRLGGNALVGPAEVPVKDPERVRTLGPGYTEEGPIATTVIASWVDGEFVIDQAAPGVMRVWGLAEGHAWTSTEPFELHAGERHDGVVLKLEPLDTRDRIGGLVLAPDGQPVESASVMAAFEWTEGSASLTETTGVDGRFSFVVQARVPHELRIEDRGKRWSPLVLSPVQPGTSALVARFEEPRWIEVHVRTRGGESVTKYQAELKQEQRLVAAMDLGPIAWAGMNEAHADGLARLFVPNVPFRISVDAPGHDLAQLGPFDPRTAPARLEVELEKLPGVCGKVKIAGGVEGSVRVQLLSAQANTWFNGYRVLYGGWPKTSTQANADGSFCVDLRQSGRYWIRAFVPDPALGRPMVAELGPLELDSRRGASGLELSIGSGGTIEGVVLVPKGENAAGRIVAFNHCDGWPITVRTDSEGHFRREHLTPGRWQVVNAPEELTGWRNRWGSRAELEPLSEENLWTCSVSEGQTTHVELDLRQEHSGTLDGHFDCAGGSCEGWTVALRETGALRSDGGATLSSTLEREGRFHFDFPHGGRYQLVFTATGEPGRTLALRHYLELDSGANSWDKRVALASLAGEGLPAESPEGVVFEYRAEGEIEASCRIVPDAQGDFALPLVLAGKGKIVRYSSGTSELGPRWKVLASFEAAEGQPASVRVP